MDNTTTAPVLARDADGHVLLTPDQAAAVAKVKLAGPIFSDDPAWAIVDALDDALVAHDEALARFTLAAEAERGAALATVAALEAARVPVRVVECQRCGSDHWMSFTPLGNPTDRFSWWGLCPETGQPVLLAIIQDDATDAA